MKRPNRSPALIASIVGIVLVAIGIGALALSQPQPRPQPAGPGGSSSPVGVPPSANPDAAIDPAACSLQTEPGPADAPPATGVGDAMDTADLGPGRYRMCLTGAAPVQVEGTAWCRWSDDRSTVQEVDGLPTGIAGGPQISGSIGLRPSFLQIEAVGAGGDVTTFGNEGDQRLVEPGPGARSGAVAFVVTEVVDAENPPKVRQPARTGMIRWSCGESPQVRAPST